EHVVQVCSDTRLLVLAAFRTTAPDRSDEVAARLAELHRLEGVRRLDLGGLDTDAIAEYVSLRSGLTLQAARAPAALLRDRTGAAGDARPTQAMAFVDSAMAVGLIESVETDRDVSSFVHALTRQTVIDRMPASRRTLLHARAAEALERQPHDASLVPRLARHYLAAHILGYQQQALRYSREAGRLAERSLAFEDAAVWFERAASLPECDPAVRSEMLLA